MEPSQLCTACHTYWVLVQQSVRYFWHALQWLIADTLPVFHLCILMGLNGTTTILYYHWVNMMTLVHSCITIKFPYQSTYQSQRSSTRRVKFLAVFPAKWLIFPAIMITTQYCRGSYVAYSKFFLQFFSYMTTTQLHTQLVVKKLNFTLELLLFHKINVIYNYLRTLCIQGLMQFYQLSNEQQDCMNEQDMITFQSELLDLFKGNLC